MVWNLAEKLEVMMVGYTDVNLVEAMVWNLAEKLEVMRVDKKDGYLVVMQVLKKVVN